MASEKPASEPYSESIQLDWLMLRQIGWPNSWFHHIEGQHFSDLDQLNIMPHYTPYTANVSHYFV